VPLSLDTRGVGKVTIIRCTGRIAAGETDVLHMHVVDLLRDRSDIVLHLGDIVFVDSSGLGMLVRLLTSTRSARGDLKLCAVPQVVQNVLKITSLSALFDTHATEEEAVLAFYKRQAAPARPAQTGLTVLCIDQSANVLAYLRELLGRAGYHVLTNNNLRDASILLRATRPGLAILGPNLKGAPGAEQTFRGTCGVPVLELGPDFSTLEAGQAASELLDKIRALNNPGSVSAS
jgi:anti-sigma B factor antagonist